MASRITRELVLCGSGGMFPASALQSLLPSRFVMVKFLLMPNWPGAFSLIRMACGTSFTVIVPDSLSTWTFIFCAKPAVLAKISNAVKSSFFISAR